MVAHFHGPTQPPQFPSPSPPPPPPLALRLSMFGQITLVPEQYRGRFEPIRGTFKSRQFQGWGGGGKQRPLLDRHTHTLAQASVCVRLEFPHGA